MLARPTRVLFATLMLALVALGCSQVHAPSAGTATTSTIARQSTSTAQNATSTSSASSTSTTIQPLLSTISTSTTVEPAAPPTAHLSGSLGLEVVNTVPHDTDAFTQGLAYQDGTLVEGLGLYGSSEVRSYPPGASTPAVRVPLDDAYFGAGIAIANNSIVQLTWREGVALIHDAITMAPGTPLSYDGEGWGICHDGDQFIMSDGTENLTFRDTETFTPTGSVAVLRDGAPLLNLSELECVDGAVWANIWLSNEIVRIDPTTGQVLASVDASSLVPSGLSPDDVLNGIAYNPVNDTFFLTGKRWPTTYEVRFTNTDQ